MARFARLLFAFALLAGWQAALLHPLEHVDAKGALVHVADGKGHAQDDPAGSDPNGKTCDALAALTACVPVEAPALVLQDVVSARNSLAPRAPRLAEAPPFLAQGPPAFL